MLTLEDPWPKLHASSLHGLQSLHSWGGTSDSVITCTNGNNNGTYLTEWLVAKIRLDLAYNVLSRLPSTL